jgi:hypothetical protein
MMPPMSAKAAGDPAPPRLCERGRHWQAAVEPSWPRLRALSMADLTYRMEQFANGGLAASWPTCIPG